METEICAICNKPHEVVRHFGQGFMGCPLITDENMFINLSAFKRAVKTEAEKPYTGRYSREDIYFDHN